MTEFKVKLASVADVRDFVQAASMHRCDIEVVSGRYNIDAKSIMGLVSLDLNRPLNVQFRGSDEMAADFLTSVREYIVA